MLPRIPRPMVGFLLSAPCRVGSPAATCPQTRSWLPYHYLSPTHGRHLLSPSPCRVGSCVTTCLWTRDQLPSLVPLWGGLPCQHVSLDAWLADDRSRLDALSVRSEIKLRPTCLPSRHVFMDPHSVPMPPHVHEPVICFLLSTPLQGELPYVSSDMWLPPVLPRVSGSAASSCIATCPRTCGRLLYLHPLAEWAPMSPRVSRPVTDFLLSVTWRGELPCMPQRAPELVAGR
jgi:hypothetical protein